ncbi:hypothetical protein AtubIFM55763_002118 [Aspergillus tubingensis]|uniref:Ribonucleases P/MRP subunit Pop8-like domain-containing protein n=1 Tax=Aspergillus tubingensis TaxID=5068 RepID=A0A8H3T2U6_ASPTU|nr:major facilitator superfamily protein [Aspergillus tubingensis]GFN20394.1 major facilitator superfamily protein [Aspergillus tubingensis]GLA57625.1 hypothetical protein AtubIFM54640_005417 [Aspergillus tubingensis]GLA71638.1 hypothetical protein AtubIFM55763_002118 [Aspergillus tubingensis]GLA86982.1 hypothetical protein AtubIFM56815_011253 [Aspergillus tubingensis]GLA97945.1 hypothetical protein AtubIFM57143_005878 [Aspergillus tubingensis]
MSTTTTTTPSKRKSDSSTPQTIHFTSRTPTWTYLKLQLINNPPTSTTSTPLDPLTARTYLSAALSQFLGLTGTTIPIDILKISPPSSSSSSTGNKTGGAGLGSTVWTRVPRDDAAAVVAALSSWIGGSASTPTNTSGAGDVGGGGGSMAWRVCAKGNYLGALVNGGGGEVFVP